MAIYENPYGSDDSLDPDAARRKALLDLMGTPDAGAAPTASQALPSSRPAPTLPAGNTRSTTASGAETPDVPDPTPPPSPSASNPYASSDGRQSGTKILDLYDDPYTRRDTYGGWDPKRKEISSALVSSGNPYAMAAGAVGYLDAYLHRKAETAPTDFSVADATQIVKDAYKDMNGGRAISDEELQGALTGQGLRAGSGWVGQAGLQGVLGHLAENALATGGGPGSAGAAASTAAPAAVSTPGGALSSNPNTGVAGGIDTGISGPGGGAGGGGGGVPGNVEGVDAGKWNDPNKHGLKYDALHTLVDAGSVDAAWPKLQQMYPAAQRVSGDVIDFDGSGPEPPIDVQRDYDGGGGFHWEPVGGASDSAASTAPATASSSLPTLPGAAQLAAPLTNNDVLQQIMDELRRVQAGEQPRAALLSQMGLA
jgi:hypothetical protein